LREYEVKKRDSGPPWALKPEITAAAEYTSLDLKESTNIKIKLVDCDGVKLGNRDIQIEVDGNGSVDKSLVTTDVNGEANIVYTAAEYPGKKGFAEIKFSHEYAQPWDYPDETVSTGTSVMINLYSTTPLWFFKAIIKNRYAARSDTVISYDLGGHLDVYEYSSLVEEETSGIVRAIIENLAEDPVNNFSYNSDAVEPHAWTVTGQGYNDEFGKYRETIDGKLVNADIRNDHISGHARPDASIFFDYSDNDKYIGVAIGIKGVGNYVGQHYGTPPEGGLNDWYEYRGQYDDYGLSVDCGCTSEMANCLIVKHDTPVAGYSADYTFTESFQEGSLEGTKYITKSQSIEVFIVPFEYVTGIKDEDYDELFPKEYSLGQNYPNPFNPLTNITYQMKRRGLVKLKVFDILGAEVATLVDEITPQGTYTISWNASNLPSGVYVYQLQAGSFIETRKMILLK
jgi:Secretion system C-terminal sorting domain